ncbi:hypothetical protein N0V82_004229 [Gnomoniopsis sp. IMI 355080]|nr:hypothetical protein N0V82_004229 [Gnomoniopsis sp. IMI 355080]
MKEYFQSNPKSSSQLIFFGIKDHIQLFFTYSTFEVAIHDTMADTFDKAIDGLAHHLSQKTANFIRSNNHRDLLDIVDKLRFRGVSHYVDLPQIIVCGSQSSGKSSTLESLSGISCPTSKGFCTRFATELILRCGDDTEINVHIIPGAGRTEKERVELAAFGLRTSDRRDVSNIIESAKVAMGLTGEGAKIFNTDVLRIELASPDQPNLTIVDLHKMTLIQRLAGLFGASDKHQSDEDLELVQNLVTGYMKQHRSSVSKLSENVFEKSFEIGSARGFLAGIEDCRAKLTQLGTSRDTIRAKQKYLLSISSRLTKLVQVGVYSVYADSFFESKPGNTDVFDRRLRANVQKVLAEHSSNMTRNGHAMEIVENDLQPVHFNNWFIYGKQYLLEVKTSLEECRSRELPGFSQELVELIHEAAAVTFNQIVSEICDENTRVRLMKGIIQPYLYKLREQLKNKVDEFLEPHLSVYPISYNEGLVSFVQETQAKRHKRKFDRVAKKACSFDTNTVDSCLYEDIPLQELLDSLLEETEPDVREYSASLAADVAAAYYQIALKKFVDDVSTNAVETCLVQCLPDVFSPQIVWDLEDDQTDALGSEDEETVRNRVQLQEKLRVLEGGLRELDAFTARPNSALRASK